MICCAIIWMLEEQDIEQGPPVAGRGKCWGEKGRGDGDSFVVGANNEVQDSDSEETRAVREE